MKNKLIAVIPIRKGSQRVKNKNFKKFSKKNLLIYKIEMLKKIKSINKIIINTDSDQAIKIAKDYKIDFFKRAKYYASSKCSNSDFWSYVGRTTNSKYILFTNCTSPLVKEKNYRDIINLFIKNKNKYDSFNTVSLIKDYLYLNKKPLNFKIGKTPNSQDLPNIFKLNFAINILPAKLMESKKTLIGKKPYFHLLSDVEGFDIDTPLDFKIAEFLFKNKSNG
tara:strand:+ start:155 stop:820 length:666 start_codon:yes stop_codon:yes gene_type:complete